MRPSRRAIYAVAAGAVALIVVGLVLAFTGRDDATEQDGADDAVTSTAGDRTVTELTASAPVAGRCRVPDASIIGAQETAFDGVVTAISGDVVTLRPSRFYAGERTDLVTVRAASADLAALLNAVEFEEGGRYLVAATGGRVALCMISAPYSQQLADLYERAFEG